MMRLVAISLALGLSTSAYAANVPVGVWRTASGKADIRISDCRGAPCATLASLKKPNDKQGRPKLDKRNPDPALRSRPVVGVSLLTEMKADGEGWSGTFYNPDDGRSYAGKIEADDADTLKLRGCVVGFICKTQVLKRVE
ncbi:DUF2147 domain-containing protein [Hansschlegelia quercus]|uniref:DUF2147 domain-containing protein n=1 Tax=Hansschlegelia quercus TaxID=2528245 RepID=A0A4Q9GF30_9HYPH|nr:DUF2147 domain-containing protein [Hansschlegelia quercus]TBN48652.1 DUF2147 domain-containing protein [Hansschlegelia quercus]